MKRKRKPIARPAPPAPAGEQGSRRRRRSPEVARQEILDAAERVLTDAHPEQVGLKEIAREAGVSHALITHYFGTYAGLLEATLVRHQEAMREQVLARLREPATVGRPDEIFRVLFEALEHPVHLRLIRWLLATERVAAMHALGLQRRGITLVAEQIARTLVPEPREPDPALVHRLEIILLTAVSAAYGYAIAKHALAGALGKQPTRELSAEVRQTLAAMVQAHIHDRR